MSSPRSTKPPIAALQATDVSPALAAEFDRKNREYVGDWIEIIDRLDRLVLRTNDMGYGEASVLINRALVAMRARPPRAELSDLAVTPPAAIAR